MRSSAADYLRRVEAMGEEYRKADLLLWPDTPMADDLQGEIVERVGASDRDVGDRRSRSRLIVRQIKRLIEHGLIGPEFSLCDIACGDAIVLWQVKQIFSRAYCAGLDCYCGSFTTHALVQRDGVELFGGFIQHLFANDPPVPFDVVLMLNTFREWESADLRAHERDLPRLAEAWFRRNARYTIVTAPRRQIRRLAVRGFKIARLGRGEDDSTMVCLSTSAQPLSLDQRLRAVSQTLGAGSRYSFLARRAYRRGGTGGVLRWAVAGVWRRLAG